MKAIECQKEQCAIILLDHDADPNLMDAKRNTALHYAALIPNVSLAGHLLEHRAHIDVQNQDGYTPLLLAVIQNHQEMVEFLLKKGADVNTRDNFKRTALILAAKGEQTGMIKLLLEYNADTSLEDDQGWTAENHATFSGFHAHSLLISQYALQKDPKQCSSSIFNSPDRTFVSGFTLGGPATDKKGMDESSSESLSRSSNKPSPADSWPPSDEEESDFSTKKPQKPSLSRLINASQQIKKDDDKPTKIRIAHLSHKDQNEAVRRNRGLSSVDYKELDPGTLGPNDQEEEEFGSNQDGQLEEFGEEEEEVFSQEEQDDLKSGEDPDCEEVETAEERQVEDEYSEPLKGKKDVIKQEQNLSTFTSKCDGHEKKLEISEENLDLLYPTDIPVSFITGNYEYINENIVSTFPLDKESVSYSLKNDDGEDEERDKLPCQDEVQEINEKNHISNTNYEEDCGNTTQFIPKHNVYIKGRKSDTVETEKQRTINQRLNLKNPEPLDGRSIENKESKKPVKWFNIICASLESHGDTPLDESQMLEATYAQKVQEESVETEDEEENSGNFSDDAPKEQLHSFKSLTKSLNSSTSYLKTQNTSRNCTVGRDILPELGIEEEEQSWKSENASESPPERSVPHLPAARSNEPTNSTSKEKSEDIFYEPSFMSGSRNFNMTKLEDTRNLGWPVDLMDNYENHPDSKSNTTKPVVIKDSVNQEEKMVKQNLTSDFMEEFGLDNADDIEDASDWDSTNTSYKNSRNVPQYSPEIKRTQKDSNGDLEDDTISSSSRHSEKSPVLKNSSEEAHEGLSGSIPQQDKVMLNICSLTEKTALKKQTNKAQMSISHPITRSEGLETNEEMYSSDLRIDSKLNWEERYEKLWAEKEKMQLKMSFKSITAELKKMFGEIFEENKIAPMSRGEPLQDIFKESETVQKPPQYLRENIIEPEDKDKVGIFLTVTLPQLPEKREKGLENSRSYNLNSNSQENTTQSSFKLCSNSNILSSENDIGCICSANEEGFADDAENTKISSLKIAANKLCITQTTGNKDRIFTSWESVSGKNFECVLKPSSTEDALSTGLTYPEDVSPISPEEAHTLSAEMYNKEKTDSRQDSHQSQNHRGHKASNSTVLENKRWKHSISFYDKISQAHPDEELQQAMQGFKKEVGVLEIGFLTLEKQKRKLQKEAEEEKIKHKYDEMGTPEKRDESDKSVQEKIAKIPRQHSQINSTVSSKERSPLIFSHWESHDGHFGGGEGSKETPDQQKPAEKGIHKKSKERAQIAIDGDLDDLTQSSDTAAEEFDFPSLNTKNPMVLIEQLGVHCNDSAGLLQLQNAFLSYERSVQFEKGRYQLLLSKVELMKKEKKELQEDLSETREIKSKLEHERVEWESELSSLRFTLKQEEEKKLNMEMKYEKAREQLKRKEDQYCKEVEMKQQLELTLRTLDLELRTVRNNLKQVEEERNDTQRQLSQEQSARALQDDILNNHLWRQKEFEASQKPMIHSSEIHDKHEKEKELQHINQKLQEEIAMLKLEVDTTRVQNQEKESRYVDENEALKEKNEDLQKELKLNEEALTKRMFQYNGQLTVLTAENAMLRSQMENEKQNKDRLETEMESYRSRLSTAIQEHEKSQVAKSNAERKFQRERDEWLRLQDKLNHDLSNLRDTNGVLSQHLSQAESKANGLENELYRLRDIIREKSLSLESAQRDLQQTQCQAKELERVCQNEKAQMTKFTVKQESMSERLAQLQSENALLRQQLDDAQNKGIIQDKVVSDVQVLFRDIVDKLHAESDKQILLVEERNKELTSKCSHLREQLYRNETQQEATIRQLQQELADSLKKQSMSEASLEVTARYRSDLEEEKQQLQKELDKIRNKLQESEELQMQYKRCNHELEDHVQKLEIENTTLEATIKQQTARIELLQKEPQDSSSSENDKENLKKLNQIKRSLENRLEHEIQKNQELQKSIDGFQKDIKTMKKKQKEYEKRELNFQGESKYSHSKIDDQVNKLKIKIDGLSQKLEGASSKYSLLETTNQDLKEQLFSLQKNYEISEKIKRQLEEEMVNLKRYQEMNMFERSQMEQYKREVDEQAKQEIVKKLEEVNLFLQTQAASQETLEKLRENNNATLINQMETRIKDLEMELARMKNSSQNNTFQKDPTQAELERYRGLYNEESNIRKSLSSKLDRANERLAETNVKLLNERQKRRSLISSLTSSPVLEPTHLGNLSYSFVFNRGLDLGGSFLATTPSTPPSETTVETYLTKLLDQQSVPHFSSLHPDP
ncbi:coiled-coil domain-containing protein 144A-like [Tachyglossus aculeatus]|uniref:coiled-coil domain-containing protein 144A-like n=1 Tax=Tachyglossus aculeatus TaxID=9261 RepID=UPI0018F7C6DA|nr:coiled-coil domain-containing protein 144A-like [Tachyglossus aculeatus]